MSSYRLRDPCILPAEPRTTDKPAVVRYNPPNGFTTWAAVVLNLTVTSNGTQFDRLASLSLNKVESKPSSCDWPVETVDSAMLTSGVGLQFGAQARPSRPVPASSGHTRKTLLGLLPCSGSVSGAAEHGRESLALTDLRVCVHSGSAHV